MSGESGQEVRIALQHGGIISHDKVEETYAGAMDDCRDESRAEWPLVAHIALAAMQREV